jgi:alpha-galactosidase
VIEQTGKLTAGFGASTTEIGPELTFGIYMEKLLGEPILLIKTSWGGRSLCLDFRPPSAGPYVLSDFELARFKERGIDAAKDQAEKTKSSGVFYRHMIEHVQRVLADIKRVVPECDPEQGYELGGFVWFQGFNDLVNTWRYPNDDYEEYGQLLAQFIRDVRKDLSAPKMPFVTGVMGIDGVNAGPNIQAFRKAQAAPALVPEFQGNVVAVQTAPYWDDDLGALQQRREALNAKMDQELKKNPSLSQEAKDEAYKKATAETFTPEELKRLKGISNGGYHYLGAARILAPIGKAFAEAIAKLQASNEP